MKKSAAEPAHQRYSHAWERLWLAVVYLATTAAPLRERALDAYENHVSFLAPQDFNANSQELFLGLQKLVRTILGRAESNPAPWNLELHGGRLEIAKHKIRDSTGRKIAKMIVELYSRCEDED